MEIQAHVPPGLAAIHNFILKYDPTDIDAYLNSSDSDFDPTPGTVQNNEFGVLSVLSNGAVTVAEKMHATQNRDEIAGGIWEDYQRVQQERESEIS